MAIQPSAFCQFDQCLGVISFHMMVLRPFCALVLPKGLKGPETCNRLDLDDGGVRPLQRRDGSRERGSPL